MKNRKRLRRVLLGGVTAVVMASGAQAKELETLKAQLQALESRVQALDTQAEAVRSGPESASVITFERGTRATADWNTARVGEEPPADRGFTIAITPSADLPAPIHEVTISGYVKGDVIYDFNQDLGDRVDYGAITEEPDSAEHVRLHARQSRFSIKSRSDTAIGEIRTLIEGDFFGSGSGFRLRHAWGEWDMVPGLTLGVGRYWRNFLSPFTGIPTVSLNGPVGAGGFNDDGRNAQLRLSYRDGPMELAVSIEDPTGVSGAGIGSDLLTEGPGFGPDGGASDNLPDLSARWQYSVPGGHEFLVSGLLRNYHTDGSLGATGSDSALGWALQGAVNINLADVATLSTSAMYGDGIGNYLFGAPFGAYVHQDGDIQTVAGLGLFAGVSVNVTETTSVNAGWGYERMQKDEIDAAADLYEIDASQKLMSVHANVIWQPINEMSLGWEMMYGKRWYRDGETEASETGHAWRGQFGAWFHF